MASLWRTSVAVISVVWITFSIYITCSIAVTFRHGTWRYENASYRPDANDLGDLERGGHITVPNHAPSRPNCEMTERRLCNGPIDVVFTWVNGSDPIQQENLRKYKGNPERLTIMYRDYGTLRFAMRSIEKFAPWINHIFLLTNGQQPDWYNKSAEKFVSFLSLQFICCFSSRLLSLSLSICLFLLLFIRTTLVTHEQVFSNLKNLPTFNSNAIESNLHKIPGLSDCFLFMNDDFFLLSPTPKDYFIDPQTGLLNLHFEKRTAPALKEMETNGWFRSVAHSNELVSQWYYPYNKNVVRHHFSSHYCYFFSKSLLEMMANRWPEQYAFSEKNRFRNDKDNAIPFLHANVALEEGIGVSKPSKNSGGSWFSNHTTNENTWNKLMNARSSAYCSCLQDRLDASGVDTEKEIEYLEQQMCKLFPEPSSVELKSVVNPCDKYNI